MKVKSPFNPKVNIFFRRIIFKIYHIIGIKNKHLYEVSELKESYIKEGDSIKVKCDFCSNTMKVCIVKEWYSL